MFRESGLSKNLSCFLRYLSEQNSENDGRLPPLTDLSKELGISIASLREQLEVARTLGLVEVKPRTGIKRLTYSFRPAVFQSLSYAATLDSGNFIYFNDLRKHIEAAYFIEAAKLLNENDHKKLISLVELAEEKIKDRPARIPHVEHCDLHLTIYSRLNNPFVSGLLEAYWDLYAASGYAIVTDRSYLEKVWNYHRKMVESIIAGEYTNGFKYLMDHMNLISERPKTLPSQKFE